MFKKIRNYFSYRSIVMEHEDEMASPQFALRVDLLGRMYTVINIPPDLVNYSKDMVETVIKQYISNTSSYLYGIGLMELVSVYAVQKLNEANYLVVFGYEHMDPRVIGFFVKYAVIGTALAVGAGVLFRILSGL